MNFVWFRLKFRPDGFQVKRQKLFDKKKFTNKTTIREGGTIIYIHYTTYNEYTNYKKGSTIIVGLVQLRGQQR